MRLLYVIDSLAPGGAETSLAEMAPGLVARGVDLHVLPLGDRRDLASRLEGSGAVVHTRGFRPGRIGSVRSVREVARRINPSLVHTTLYESDVAGRIAASLLQLPASTSIVNDSYSESHYEESNTAKLNAARAIDAVTARSVRRFHAISGAIADSVAPRLWIPREKVRVIPRGRDPHSLVFQPAGVRDKTRRELGIPPNTHVILAIGRLEPQKGLHHLLNALPAVEQHHRGIVVLIAGKDGRSSRELKATAAQLRLDVRFLGHREDVPALLAAADVFCFPSEREGFGGVLIEALAVGCPIVASAIPTSSEVLGIGNSSVGILTPVGDVYQLGKSLERSLARPQAAAARAREGRIRFDASYTIESVTSQMADYFGACASP